MSPVDTDAQAAKIVEDYAKVVNFATAKAYRKWESYLGAQGDRSPFTPEDIRQYALEAILLLAGLLPGHAHKLSGTLGAIEAQGGERYVQRSVDSYVSMCIAHTVEKARAVKRGGDEYPISLDAPANSPVSTVASDGGDPPPLGDLLTDPMEANPAALGNVEALYPILHLTEIAGLSRREAIEYLGVTEFAYKRARRAEIESFSAWALRNRRVAA